MTFPAETEGLYESLPESVVSSVLDRWGYKDSAEPATTDPAPTDPSPEPESDLTPEVPQPVPEPPVEPEPAGEPEPAPAPSEPAPEVEPEITEIPAPGGPVWTPETPEAPPTPGVVGPSPTPQQLAVYQQLEQRINTDPAFRAGLQALLTPVAPPAALYPPLPQLSPEDIQDPATQALVMIAHRQQQELADLRNNLSLQAQQVQQQAHKEALEVSNAARSSFKQQYNLPDNIMDEIDRQVVPHDISYYMANVKADPYGAAEFALTRAYWNSQPARQFEFERQADNRAKALDRKQRLAGVGGSSGSSPRTTPAPDMSTPESRKQAAIAEVTTAMFGDQQ